MARAMSNYVFQNDGFVHALLILVNYVEKETLT